MYMKLKRSTYLIILIFLAVFYFSYFKKTKEGFVENSQLKESCLECKEQCSPNYDELCLKTVQSCIDCKNTKKEILPKSWISIDRNNNNTNNIYELSKKINPEILVVNQLINANNIPTSGIQPTMTNIEISAHPNFDKLDFNPRNLITGMFTNTDPVPSNSTLQRKDVIDPKFSKL